MILLYYENGVFAVSAFFHISANGSCTYSKKAYMGEIKLKKEALMSTITVNGMHCQNCSNSVKEAMAKAGANNIVVDLEKNAYLGKAVLPRSRQRKLSTIKALTPCYSFLREYSDTLPYSGKKRFVPFGRTGHVCFCLIF